MKINLLNERKGKKWILLYVLYSINFLIYLAFILLLEPFWGDINFTVSGWVGFDINIVLIVTIIIIIPLCYGIILLVIYLRKIIKKFEIKPNIVNKILPIVLMVVYLLLIIILIEMLEDYANVIFQVIEFYSFFLYLILAVGLILLIFPIAKLIPQLREAFSNKFLNARTKKSIILITLIILYSFACTLPFLFIPSNVIYGALPAKPLLIGHRGASHLAPENTIEAGEAALEFGSVVGWEVDIQISYDGVPFLMHDDTLLRTTNVTEHFPNRSNEKAWTFNISELLELDAGSWFVNKDPFGVIAKGIISEEKAEAYRGIKIPTFQEAINFTRDNGFIIDFDAYRPPADHPYYDDFYEILLNITIDSGIDLTKVMIPTGNADWIQMITDRAPQITLGWGGSPTSQDFLNSPYNYTYINTGDGYSNDGYRDLEVAGIDVMVWTIESVERYCQLWCLGANWVKTNSPYKFDTLSAPVFYMSFNIYIWVWIIIYVGLIGVVVINFFVISKRKSE